ncbi:type II secretion system F family protein [Candidatus Beckwithbacteria bacterium]|nr:type II secretion system F family protein [Candidatus Beckwithbacteria bacterium]
MLFTYKVILPNGKLFQQTLKAKDEEEVATVLRSKNLQILSIRKIRQQQSIFAKGVSNFEKANFCRYFSVMIKSGLSLSEALDIISSETENKTFKSILQDLQFEIQQGGSISDTLSKYPQVFDEVFLALVKAGEHSGSLEKTFYYLSEQLYASHRLTKKIQGAMMYPAVILIAMLGMGIGMMLFVLPKLSETFMKMKIEMPPMTKAVFAFGTFVGKNVMPVSFVLLSVIVIIVFLFTFYQTRRAIGSFLVNLPILSKLFRQMDWARFARTLATLLQSGVPVIESLNISAQVLTQNDMKKVASNFEKELEKGKTIAEVLGKGKKAFPSLMIQTIKTGEKTGTLDSILLDVALFYENELEDMLKELSSMLEPIIMLVLGIAVGAMVLIILAPVYSILGDLQGPGGAAGR